MIRRELLAYNYLYPACNNPLDFEDTASNKSKDWTTPLTPPLEASKNLCYAQTNTLNEIQNQKNDGLSEAVATNQKTSPDFVSHSVYDLCTRLMDILKGAKSRHLSCRKVLLPFSLIPHVADEIVLLSEDEPCGIRGCTIYVEFEDKPNSSKRIGSLKVDPEMVSTFEIYLTLRRHHRGWTSLLPQFMNICSTITISSEYNITKTELYSPFSSSYSYCSSKSSLTSTD